MYTRMARRALAALLLLTTLFGALGGTVFAATDPAAAAQAALGWMIGRQQADGSFPGFDAGASADAVLAIAASGGDPNGVITNGSSPVSYLGTQASTYATKSVGAAGKLTLAVVAAGKDPLNFGGQNLLALIQAGYDAQTGRYGAQTTDHVFALLALASTGQPIPPAALQALTAGQLPDGGWSFDGTPATGSDTNTTALAVQALVATGSSGDALSQALAYLRTQQNADGGFPYAKSSSFGADSDANSTAAVVQALVAAGQDPRSMAQGDNNPLSALTAFQNPSGALRYQTAMPDDNDLATAQAVPALLLKPFPITRVSLPPQAAPATVPAALPSTGGAMNTSWALVAAALLLVATGAALQIRRAR